MLKRTPGLLANWARKNMRAFLGLLARNTTDVNFLSNLELRSICWINLPTTNIFLSQRRSILTECGSFAIVLFILANHQMKPKLSGCSTSSRECAQAGILQNAAR